MSVRKTFDKSLYETNDRKAREAGKMYWKQEGCAAIDNPDKYGADLIVNDSFYCEVEIKNVWSGSEFPWGSIQLPERKTKFTKLDKHCVFLIFNKELTHGITFTSEAVLASPLVEVSNKFVSSKEETAARFEAVLTSPNASLILSDPIFLEKLGFSSIEAKKLNESFIRIMSGSQDKNNNPEQLQ